MAKKVRRQTRPDSVPYTDKAFRPYVAALGQIALAWNGLHQSLAMLFCLVMGGGFVGRFLAIWHAIKNDRTQRDVLLAAAKAETGYQSERERRLIDDVEWICKRADSVEEARNNALHSPLWGNKRGPEIIVMPVIGLGHDRAKKLWAKLKDKDDLLVELRWCRRAAMTLNEFAQAIDDAMTDSRVPWPERPTWPTHERPNSTKRHRPARRVKHPRPPPPSPE
jgi:hypothetical protein